MSELHSSQFLIKKNPSARFLRAMAQNWLFDLSIFVMNGLVDTEPLCLSSEVFTNRT